MLGAALLVGLGLITTASAWCPQMCTCYSQNEEDVKVDCTGPQVTEIPDNLPHNTTKLYLQDTSITSIPAGKLVNLTQLVILDFKGSQVSQIDSHAFQQQSNLRQLVLERNRFTNIPTACFARIPTLQELLMNHNAIVELTYNAFNGLRSLQHLDMGFNHISTINPSSFNALQNLTDLKLNDNRISSLNSASVFSSMRMLSILHLQNNRISSLTANSFGSMQSLQTLYVSGNQISSVDCNTFQNMVKLEKLYLDKNQIEQVPNSCVLSRLHNLKTLDLSENRIRQVPSQGFASVPSIQHLRLNTMKTMQLVELNAFHGLPNLNILSLHSNPNLTEFTAGHLSASRHPEMVQLFLHDNGITYAQQEVFTSHQRLLKATFHGNPLHCNCSLKWIANVIRNFHKYAWAAEWTVPAGSPWCGSPDNMRDALFKDLIEDNLTCDKPEIRPVSAVRQTAYRGLNTSIIALSFPGRPSAVWNNPQGQALSPGHISEGERIVVMSQLQPTDHRLREGYYISNVTAADHGTYRLVVQNAGGQTTREFYLEVEEAPPPTTTLRVTSAAEQCQKAGLLLIYCMFLLTSLSV